MDDQRIGALLRHLRVSRGLRQVDVAILAGVSDSTISRLERGDLVSLSVGALRRVARVLEARLDLSIWSRGGDIERVADRRHAELVESLIRALVEAGWVARPEVSFNLRGERGLVDIVAWHPTARVVLLIEVKTEIVDVGELFGTFDRKQRLGLEIARASGFEADRVACALVVADTAVNHRRIAAHAATFGAALPDRGLRFRSFIRRPVGELAALAFWTNSRPRTTKRKAGGTRRDRRPRSKPVSEIRRSRKRG